MQHDARLPDGSRVNAIIPPLAFSGSTLTAAGRAGADHPAPAVNGVYDVSAPVVSGG